MSDLANALSGVIQNLLTIPNQLFSTNNPGGNALYTAWSGMRTIALALLALAALIMIMSQALSVGPLDAYTVKKLLPRVVAAAILVTLSWPLMGFLVGVSNGLGHSVSALIYAPFAAIKNTNVNLAGTLLTNPLTLLGGAAIFGAIGGVAAVLLLALSILLALLAGFVTIVFRQMLIILLVIMAPIALVLYTLPGGERGGRMWWDNLWKALLMFPLIEAFIAVGGVFSKLAQYSGAGVLDEVIAIVAMFLPYFLLPATFKMAGSAMAAVSGEIQNIKQPLSNALKKARGGQYEKNWQKIQTGQRFRAGSLLSKAGANSALFAASHAGEFGLKPSRWKDKYKGMERRYSTAERADYMKTAQFQDIADDPKMLLAALEFADHQDEKRAAERAGLDLNKSEDRVRMTAAIEAARSGSKRTVMTAAALARAGLNGAYDDHEAAGYASEYDMEMSEIARASGSQVDSNNHVIAGTGDAHAAARTWGEYRSIAQQSGFATRAAGSWGGGYTELTHVMEGKHVDTNQMQGDVMRFLDANGFARMKPNEQEKVMAIAQSQLQEKMEEFERNARAAGRAVGNPELQKQLESTAIKARNEAEAIRASMQQIAGSSFYLSGESLRNVARATSSYGVAKPAPRGEVPIAQRVAGAEQQAPPTPPEQEQS